MQEIDLLQEAASLNGLVRQRGQPDFDTTLAAATRSRERGFVEFVNTHRASSGANGIDLYVVVITDTGREHLEFLDPFPAP